MGTGQNVTPRRERQAVIAIVLGIVALMGYCWYHSVQLLHRIGPAMRYMNAAADTTHHVAAGSGVYLDSALVAPIIAVRLARPDTGVALHGAESTTFAMMTQIMALTYVASPSENSGVAARLRLVHWGIVHGTYDDSLPVRIDLLSSPPRRQNPIPAGNLQIDHARDRIILYGS